MNIYAATAILFLSSAQAQQIQSPTAALTTFVPTEGSADGEQVAEALKATSSGQPSSTPFASPSSLSSSMSMLNLNTAQIVQAFGGYDSKSSKTRGHGYGGYGYGGYDAKSDKGYGSAKSDKGGYGYDSKSAKGSEYSSGYPGSAKGGKTGGSGYGGYGGGGGYGAAIEAPLQQSTFEIEETSATPAVEVEETSAPEGPDVKEIINTFMNLLTGLLDDEGQADAKPATFDFDIDAISGIIEYLLNGYGSKSSKSKSGKRF